MVKTPPVSAGDGKISCRRKWLPSPVVLPGKSHGQRSRVGSMARVGVGVGGSQKVRDN